MPSWIARAVGSPAIHAASESAMSIPADTPAAVTTVPARTTRRETGSAPYWRSVWSSSQWVVASRPTSSPAAPSSSAPVQTEVVHWAPACAPRSHASIASSPVSCRVPRPPGTTITSGSGRSDRARSAVTPSIPFSVRLTPGVMATNDTSAPGRRDSTS